MPAEPPDDDKPPGKKKEMKRVNNSKYDNNDAPLIINDGPREARLDDIVYGYGGEEAIHQSGPDTPVHILCAYKELCLL